MNWELSYSNIVIDREQIEFMIGIITLQNHGTYNYGGILQNYALLHFLNTHGYEAKAIYCDSYSVQGVLRDFLMCKFNINLYKESGKFKVKCSDKLKRMQCKNFERFINSNIKPAHYLRYSNRTYSNINECFDKIIVGSDQVWNPQFAVSSKTCKTLFLTFLPSEKRISYAASFGVSSIPANIINVYKKALSDFSWISVREDSGSAIVKGLIGKDVPVVLDPTMLLSADDWVNVAKKPKHDVDAPYILKYFLGEQNPEICKDIDIIGRKNGLIIRELNNSKTTDYISGPAEFLYLFNHASLICTDSFHAVAFSIIFNKPFIVYNRVQDRMLDMSTRINTILSKFNLEQRKAALVSKDNIFSMDYTEVSMILQKERMKSIEFLTAALNYKASGL